MFFAGERDSLFNDGELKAAFLREDAVENDLDAIASAKAASPTLADDFVRVFTEGVAIVAQSCDGDETFNEEISQLDKHAVFGWIEHECGELFAYAILH